MKQPKLETIQLPVATSSVNFFRRDVMAFESFWHYHPEVELTLIRKGYGMRIVGDSVETFTDNDLVLLGENLPHNYITADLPGSPRSIAYVFQFSKDVFSTFPECASLMKLFTAARHGLRFVDPEERLLQKIERYESLSPLNRLIGMLEILDALNSHPHRRPLSSISYHQQHTALKHQNRLSEVTNYIFENLDQVLTLEKTAQFAGMSLNSFCRWFKQSTGYTFVTYLNMLRIEKACQYLLQTDWLISEIAYKAGFETVTHFNRTFKKVKKVSPKVYRKNYKFYH